MRVFIAITLSVLYLLGPRAVADLEKGTYAPDIEAKDWKNTDEPLSLHELRGMVVLLFFWVSWHKGGEYVMPMMNFINSKFGRSQGVFLIGLTDADRTRVEQMLEKERVLFPVGMESKSYEEYKLTNFPRVVVIDPQGRVAWTGWPGEKGGDTLFREVQRVIAETPPTRTHPIEAAEVRRNLADARRALRDENYREAYKKATAAFNRALTGDPLKTECQDMLDLIEALGRDKVARAEQAADEKEFETVVTLLRDVQRDYRGSEVSREATRWLKLVQKKHKEVADLIKEQEDEVIANNLLAAALDELRAGKFGEAYVKLEDITADYSATQAAAKAQTVLDRMKKNEDMMLYVKDYQAAAECTSLLSQARGYERSGRPNKAKELYLIVIEKYGDTVHADEARRRIAELP